MLNINSLWRGLFHRSWSPGAFDNTLSGGYKARYVDSEALCQFSRVQMFKVHSPLPALRLIH